jgi:catechol 2,3-dioxygenase-like lactoylglutathione lyase family enzyme
MATAASCFSHVTLGSNDLPRSRAFYDAALAPLGLVRLRDDGDEASGYGREGDEQERLPVWILKPFDGRPAVPGNGIHVAFLARSREAVDAFWAAAMKTGGSDEGKPGLRPHYHANYYAAYVRDPDGNKLQAVCHDPE